MDFITQLFTALSTRDSVLILVFLIGAWILGYLVKHIQLSTRIDELESDLRAARSSLAGVQTELSPSQQSQAVPAHADDLKRLEGIGPKIEELLNTAGIYTWKQLSNTSPAVLSTILQKAGDRFRIHDPSSWPEQARLLSEGRIDEFDKLVDTLTGGRR